MVKCTNRVARERSIGRFIFGVAAGVSLWLSLGTAASAETIELKDGRTLEGKLAKLSAMAENPATAKGDASTSIVMVDDDLRRTFVTKLSVVKVNAAGAGLPMEKIVIHQPVSTGNLRVARVGRIVRLEPFDSYGRRLLTMMTERGEVDVIQGITLITPNWIKVESLQMKDKQTFQWDMRIATSSVPREILSKVLATRVDRTKLQDRLKIVRLYVQGERYQDAENELAEVIKEFPDQDALKEFIRTLHQMHARRILDEITMRRKAGQHRLALSLLKGFPTNDVAGTILQQVREMLGEYAELEKQGTDVLKELEKNKSEIKEAADRIRCDAIHKEIIAELGINTLDRMAAALQFADDATMSAEQKFSLAVSGWLLGSDDATPNLALSLSLVEGRNLVRQYLRESRGPERDLLLKKLRSQEGTTPQTVAKLISHMKPPMEAGEGDNFKLTIPDIDKQPDVNYHVQLPPGYDPYRRYPTVVTLNGGGSTAEQQLDWWAGSPDAEGHRVGQASRYGYIIIAVDWTKQDQSEYEFSAREHAAVLGCLRDASRRFSIDSDRVFLSGHAMGGDAAWDIALAHPDLWAGVIPIVSRADKYCSLYWTNAKYVSFYFVGGELDSDKTVRNAKEQDKYMKHNCDVTVVEYEGRGHEHFYDEIQRIFDWMGRRHREFFPKHAGDKEHPLITQRSWDNFFWWLEIRDYPANMAVDPVDWPPASGNRPGQVIAEIFPAVNHISVTKVPGKVTVWLSPELVNFNNPLKITVVGKQLKTKGRLISPDLDVILEDVRTRGDRLHPFWAKVEQP